MAEIKVNKPEAARRQINLAIKLLFDGEDPVAIHTLAMAGFRIVRDLAKDVQSHQLKDAFEHLIKPGMEREFWKAINRPANFFKHADLDPYEVLSDVKEDINDLTLFLASHWYHELGYELTPEMKALISWVSVLHPNLLRDEAPFLKLLIRHDLTYIQTAPRSEQLEIGKMALALAKESK